jgi:hypothetical protein
VIGDILKKPYNFSMLGLYMNKEFPYSNAGTKEIITQ